MAIHLDTAERSQIADTTSHIECVEHRCKGTDGVSAWRLHLTHHINHDGTRLTKGGLDFRTLIVTTEFAANTTLGS